MPIDKQKTFRLQVINDCLRNPNKLYSVRDLLDECNKRLVTMDFRPISSRTINNDLKELQKKPYEVEFDETLLQRRPPLYRYADTTYTIQVSSINEGDAASIGSAIDVLRQFEGIPQYDYIRVCLERVKGNMSLDRDNAYVSFQNNPDLIGIEHFQPLLAAIMNRQPLQITYHPFGKENSKEMIVHPYHLKQYNDRWFLLALVEGFATPTVLPLDRIENNVQVKVNFRDPSFEPSEYFDDVVGVSVNSNKKVEDVVIRVDARRYPYLATKPIHPTQTELKSESTKSTKMIRLQVQINNELETTILSYGEDMEVLSPEWLRNRIKDRIKRLEGNYF